MFGKVFMSHCQDEDLVGHGQINEGKVSTRLALEGWPAAGEELQIARDIEIAKLTGAKLHIQHISTAHGLELVRAGKAAGVQVTCEATPHHMFLTENDIGRRPTTPRSRSIRRCAPRRMPRPSVRASSTAPSTLSSPITLLTPRGRRPVSSSLRPLV